MKSVVTAVSPLVLAASLVLFSPGTPAQAQGERERNLAERMERLEHQVRQMAEHQEQFTHRVGEALKQRPQIGPRPGAEMQPRPPMPPQVPHGKAPAAKGLKDLVGLMLLIGMICNIIIAVWIFGDIRKRGEGSGIFIVLALLAGFPTAIVYALVRLADQKKAA